MLLLHLAEAARLQKAELMAKVLRSMRVVQMARVVRLVTVVQMATAAPRAMEMREQKNRRFQRRIDSLLRNTPRSFLRVFSKILSKRLVGVKGRLTAPSSSGATSSSVWVAWVTDVGISTATCIVRC